MSNQRMAGSNQFKYGVESASKPRGEAQLMGAGAWDTQVQRESAQYNNTAVQGSRNADNIAAYARVSKSATRSNRDFSENTGNKWVSNARDQKGSNQQENAGFSARRIEDNTDFANQQREHNENQTKDFAGGVVNQTVNYTKAHREDNTSKNRAYGREAVNYYLESNKRNQAVDIAALDAQIRQAPQYDGARSKVQGLNVYGDRYRYGRESLPQWKQPDPMEATKTPDFNKMYEKTTSDIKSIKI
jgi:hypothetical protein